MAAYLNVPVYRAFHEWMGRTDPLAEYWELWSAGDRKGAMEKIPDEIVDQLIVHGSPDECRSHIARYMANGIDCPVLMPLPVPGIETSQVIRDLAPIN